MYIYNWKWACLHIVQRPLTLCFGRVGGDVIEDVDEDKEEGDKEWHPAGDNLRGNEEWDPGDHYKEARGEVVGDQVVREVTGQDHLESRHTEVTQLPIVQESEIITCNIGDKTESKFQVLIKSQLES